MEIKPLSLTILTASYAFQLHTWITTALSPGKTHTFTIGPEFLAELIYLTLTTIIILLQLQNTIKQEKNNETNPHKPTRQPQNTTTKQRTINI